MSRGSEHQAGDYNVMPTRWLVATGVDRDGRGWPSDYAPAWVDFAEPNDEPWSKALRVGQLLRQQRTFEVAVGSAASRQNAGNSIK